MIPLQWCNGIMVLNLVRRAAGRRNCRKAGKLTPLGPIISEHHIKRRVATLSASRRVELLRSGTRGHGSAAPLAEGDANRLYWPVRKGRVGARRSPIPLVNRPTPLLLGCVELNFADCSYRMKNL